MISGDKSSKSKFTTNPYFFKGDDGIYMAGDIYKGTMEGGQPVFVFDPPMLVHPYDLYVGKTWKNDHTLKSGLNDFSSLKEILKQTETVEITGRETISIPAGTFDCYILSKEQVSSGPGFTSKDTSIEWFAPGIGTVKLHRVVGGSMTVDTVLTDYKIN